MEEIGRNSVTPSTTPRTAAFHQLRPPAAASTAPRTRVAAPAGAAVAVMAAMAADAASVTPRTDGGRTG